MPLSLNVVFFYKISSTSLSEYKGVFIHCDELMFALLSDVFQMQAAPQTPIIDKGIY